MPAMIAPTPGVTYYFQFDIGYESTDGVYKVVKVMTYDEYLLDNGDILRDFFMPNGKTQVDLDADIEKVRTSKILKLVNPDAFTEDTDPTFVPLNYVRMTPDHHIRKYFRIGIVGDIGITDKPTDLNFAKEAIREHLEAALGVDIDPQFVTIEEAWMADSQYQELLAERDNNKKKVINYFTECGRLQNQLASMKTILNSYEELIVQQQHQLEELLAERVTEEDNQ